MTWKRFPHCLPIRSGIHRSHSATILRIFEIYFVISVNELWNKQLNRVADGLTHWGRVTHICVGKLSIIGSDNGLSTGRRQAIIWTTAGILLIGPLGTNFSEILIEILTFSFVKTASESVVCETMAILSRPQCVKTTWRCHCNARKYGQWHLLLTWFNLIPAWICNHMPAKVWGEIDIFFKICMLH